MGRSVLYANEAELVTFHHIEYDDDELIVDYRLDMMIEYLQDSIPDSYPSFYVGKTKWDNNETFSILENDLCIVFLSEYCGILAVSIQPKDYGYSDYVYTGGIARNWIRQIAPKFTDIVTEAIGNRLNRLGTFSNGNSVYTLSEPSTLNP